MSAAITSESSAQVKAPLVIRESDRVQFLPGELNGCFQPHKSLIGRADFGVILWTGEQADKTPVTLTIDAGPFNFHQSLTPEQARRLGAALIAAADEAEVPA